MSTVRSVKNNRQAKTQAQGEKRGKEDSLTFKNICIFVFLSFVAWRIWLQVFLWLGIFVLPLKSILIGGADKYFLHPGLWAWSNFDGEHYLAIAQHGYGDFEQAFFPFYPFLIKTFAPFFGSNLFSFLLSSLFLSHVFFFLAVLIFYLLVRIDYDNRVSKKAVIFLLVFPTSFFFISSYTESLFLFLVLGSFYSSRRGHWFIASVLGILAASTRPIGIFLFPALLWEWWSQHDHPRSIRSLIPILLIPLGLLYYVNFLNVSYGDPLLFIRSQPFFGAERSVDKVVLIYQVFWRYFKMAMTTRFDPLYYTIWLELLSTVIFLGGLIAALHKKVRFSYLIFAFFAFLTPTLTGTFSSMPRYVLVLFPCFIVFAKTKESIVSKIIILVSCVLLALTTIFFTRGYFVG